MPQKYTIETHNKIAIVKVVLGENNESKTLGYPENNAGDRAEGNARKTLTTSKEHRNSSKELGTSKPHGMGTTKSCQTQTRLHYGSL